MMIMYRRVGREVRASQMGRGVTYRRRGCIKRLQKKGRVKFRKRGWVKCLQKRGG